jgi:hypothetical protein
MAATVKDLLTAATTAAKNSRDAMDAARATAARIAAGRPGAGTPQGTATTAPAGTSGGGQ